MMKGYVSALLIIIGLVTTVITGVNAYQVWANTEAMLDRAQVSSEMTSMAANLEAVQTAMESYGMTKGHAAFIFKSPINDMALNYKAVVDLHNRARLLSESSPTSTEYNVALDDMRGTIRELQIETVYWWLIRNVLAWVSLSAWITGIVTGWVWLDEE